MSTEVLAWEDPPEVKGRGLVVGRWQSAVLALKERPGEWAKLADQENANTMWSARRSLTAMGCEVAMRQLGTRASLWARWPSTDTTNGHDALPSNTGLGYTGTGRSPRGA